MENKQAEKIFQNNTEELPDNGIFIDLDIYREKDQFYKDDFLRTRITNFVKESFRDGRSIIDEFQEVLNGK